MPVSPLNANRDPNPSSLISLNALRRAWQQVRRSGSAPGSDGIRLEQYERDLESNLNRLRRQLLDGSYQSQPVRRFYVKKASGLPRPISLWSLQDRIAQRVIHDYLTALLEPLFLDCSYGFRPGKGIEHAVRAVCMARDSGLQWVLDTDIADCFDSIPLEDLVRQVRRVVDSPLVIHLIDHWLHTPVQNRVNEIAGVSQGGVISPLLANLYLHRFDEMITAALPQSCLVRFADDLVILSRTQAESDWSLEVAQRSLANLRLRLNIRKTRLLNFEAGFAFLGVTFKGNRVLRNESSGEG